MFTDYLMYCGNCKKYYSKKSKKCLKCGKELAKRSYKMSIMTNICFASFVLVLLLDIVSIIISIIDLNSSKANGIPFFMLVLVGIFSLIYYFGIFYGSKYCDINFKRGSKKLVRYILFILLIIPPFVYFENKIRDRNLSDVIFDLIQFILIISIIVFLIIVFYYCFIKKDKKK